MDYMNQERERPAPVKPQPVPTAKQQPSAPKRKKKLPEKWIALCAAVIFAVSVVMGLFVMLSGEPRVRNAEDAAGILAERADELGYTNALSELTEVHSAIVGGDSYYRLQQNYRGIPVYGRTVVYAADEQGKLLSVTQNVLDVPEDLDLTPAITADQTTGSILSYLTETYPNTEVCVLPAVTLEEESLCIYSLDGTARLAYETYVGSVRYLIDAHTAEVLCCNDTIRTAKATFAASGSEIDVLRRADGTYILKDENTGTFVFSAQDRSYYNTDAKFFQCSPDSLQIISSSDNIFGNGNDSINESGSLLRAENLLKCTNEIRAFYESIAGYVPIDNLVLVYDDHLNDRLDGGACGGGWTKVSALLGIGNDLSEYDPGNDADYAGLISVGTWYSNYAEDYEYLHVDVIAHEYTHIITGYVIDWEGNRDDNETGALDEAFSDIFGELFQVHLRGNDYWVNSRRIIADPHLSDNAVVAGENGEDGPFPSANGTDIFKYHYSTVISHAAYKMWRGLDGISGSAISTEDMARLWYTAMLMLPSDADFGDCRTAVTLAAEHMGLTEAQQLGIAQAFDEAGIYDERYESEICYLVNENFTLTVYGDDNEPYGNYRIEVEEDCGSLEILLGKKFHSISEEPGERTIMGLNNGTVYVVTLTNLADPNQTVSFHLKVQKDGSDQLHLYTNFKEPEEEPGILPSEEAPWGATEAPGESQPTQPESSLDASGEAPYRIVRWDRSYRIKAESSGMDYYFDYVVLEGDSPAYQKINDAIYADAENFMTFHSADAVITDGFGYPIVGKYQAESHVIFNQDGLLCIKVSTLDAMGGNTDHVDSYSIFFNLNTGEIAMLTDLTGMDEETLLPELKRIALAGLKDVYGSMLFENAESSLNHMTLEDFDYYVSDGQIWLHFEKYSMAPGMCGAANVPTGLYIGGNGDQ